MIKFHHLCLSILLLIFCVSTASAQTDGLGFCSHEAIPDKRTGLALGADRPLCFTGSFELSFEVSFTPRQKNYFGYVVRLIQNEERNIDILYDYDPKFGDKHFRVIIGDSYSGISFSIPDLGVSDAWHKIRLNFDAGQGVLTVTRDQESFREKLAFPASSCYRVFFGANDYKTFRNADVPPMQIRNVRAGENGVTRHVWQLNEEDGAVAADSLGRRAGTAVNPVWIRKMHRNWQPLQRVTLNGPTSVAFNQEEGILYLVTRDSLFSYHLLSNKIVPAAYTTGEQNLHNAYQSVYNPRTREIYTFSLDLKRIGRLKVDSLAWNRQLDPPDRSSGYGHFNKYLQGDSLLYTFNGYGFFQYRSDIYSTAVPLAPGSHPDSAGSTITPRYLAAAGADTNGLYLIGGYGNASGKQVLNPKNLYDLQYFDAHQHTFKKLYELKKDTEEFVFANSLVIRPAEQAYFGLIFPKHKFNSALQMIKGSLQEPVFEAVGNKIPFEFQDVDAYADLFYSAAAKRFVAVTLYSPDDHSNTTVNIYSLYDPPFPAEGPLAARPGIGKNWLLAIAVLTVLLLLGAILSRVIRKEIIPGDTNALSADVSAADFAAEPPRKSAIYLFGDFQVFDAGGTDITKLFTPLIRELFLIILLYTVKWERGISAEKLKEQLWFDKSPDSARNNLAVNIAKLKNILDKVGFCEISKDTRYWKIKTGDQLYIDYMAYLPGTKQTGKPTRQELIALAGIIRRGSFLPTGEYEWLDPFKAEIPHDITERFLQYAGSTEIKEDPNFLIRLADYLYAFDMVNEDVMRLKCKALIHLGKHSLAHATFENFVREYHKLYGENYLPDFQQTIS
ncbi:hypothetical protein ACTJJ0_29955 [Chitinophaga sp. 22321]|uniref:Two-component response regulator, SAPR family, consists of REC, wHTH and BTAD domains n=1 Tax=Chitinophaga hostae TaxID=2831022 RepID=A0ABS5J7M8_9BACT|nr:hypothetical protein [Chitinophaga hostae]MBS0031224.1 hypothetical protein [Chitinophaga hostae]